MVTMITTDTETRPVFQRSAGSRHDDAFQHFREWVRIRASLWDLQLASVKRSFEFLETYNTVYTSAWRKHLSAAILGAAVRIDDEPTDAIKMDEAHSRAGFITNIDALLRQLEGEAEPTVESAGPLIVGRVSDFVEPSNDEFLDESWEPVPVQRVRAAAPVQATVRFATPRPFEAD